jgi:hypothetical protein
VPPALDVERRAAEQPPRAGVGLEQSQPERDRRRLARPVRPQNRQQLATSDFQIEASEGDRRAVPLVNALNTTLLSSTRRTCRSKTSYLY